MSAIRTNSKSRKSTQSRWVGYMWVPVMYMIGAFVVIDDGLRELREKFQTTAAP